MICVCMKKTQTSKIFLIRVYADASISVDINMQRQTIDMRYRAEDRIARRRFPFCETDPIH